MVRLESALRSLVVAAVLLLAFGAAAASVPQSQATGPLRVHPTNGRYFTDGSGKAIYLTGSHSWKNLMDGGATDPPPVYDYAAFLNLLASENHNFFRLWVHEYSNAVQGGNEKWYAPFPWARTGPGTALDGKPRFDMTTFNQAYFNRLRSRVIAARDRGFYVGIMLFEGWGLRFFDAPSRTTGHWSHPSNNINGINGDPNGDGYILETHTLQIPAVTAIQKAYIEKVIDTVNDLDNVLYDICNESHFGSRDWQYHLINHIKTYQQGKPKRHPVGMTAYGAGGQPKTNQDLFGSPADWISPGGAKWDDKSDPYASNPPAADGSKVLILDSDHVGMGVMLEDDFGRMWVWKCLVRGYHPILMENLNTGSPYWTQKVSARSAMGHTLTYAKKMDLAAMTPQNGLSSTTYCLANGGSEYLVYQPGAGAFTVNLTAGTYTTEWFDPKAGSVAATGSVTAGGGNETFTPPFAGDAVLYLKVNSTTILPPQPPSGLMATAVSSSRIDLSWMDNATNETGFVIERAVSSTGPWSQVATPGMNLSSHSDTGLAPSTAYWYRVRAINGAGDSADSNIANATTLSVAPPPPPPPAPVGLVGHWMMDEGSGTVAWDSSGAGNDGTLRLGPAWTGGILGGALSFDGIDDFVEVPGDASLTPAGEVAVAAWVLVTARDTSGSEVLSMGDSYGLRIEPDGNVRFFIYTGGTWASVATAGLNVADGMWHHLVGQKAPGGLEVYVDGVLAATVGAVGTIEYGLGTTLVLGRHGSGSADYDFGGSLDDARVYDMSLTASEVSALAGAGSSPPPQSPGPGAGPAGGSRGSEGGEGCGATGIEALLLLGLSGCMRKRLGG